MIESILEVIGTGSIVAATAFWIMDCIWRSNIRAQKVIILLYLYILCDTIISNCFT